MLTRVVATSLRCLILVAILCGLSASVQAGPKTGFTSFVVGNPADAQPAPTMSPGLVLMGGGTDVDAAFQWMCQRAGGGDFVVIRHPDGNREVPVRLGTMENLCETLA